MKTKKASKTNTRSRILFFAVLFIYNLLLSLYLKDFLVISPMLVTLYLLSALPTLFFVLKIRSAPMRTIVFVVLFFVVIMIFIIAALILSYNFVCKPESPYLLNGGATLWDTQAEELADEICADSDTDAEKVQVIYNWMIANFEYDYNYQTLLQYFNVRRTLSTGKGICFSHFSFILSNL